jgi:hypothetical protein
MTTGCDWGPSDVSLGFGEHQELLTLDEFELK